MSCATRQRVCFSAGRFVRVAALTLSFFIYGLLPSAPAAAEDCGAQAQQESLEASATRETRIRLDLARVTNTTEFSVSPRQLAGRSMIAADATNSIVSRPTPGSSLPLRL
jgi:hypothetical protein